MNAAWRFARLSAHGAQGTWASWRPTGGRGVPAPGALDGRTLLVTGATGGMGHAIAGVFARAGATVLVHGRTLARAREAVERLGAGDLRPVAGDLETLGGVDELAVQARAAAPEGLDVLVNNAGAAFAQPRLTADGVERTLAVNLLAQAALAESLLDHLRAPARIVSVNSVVEAMGRRLPDWGLPADFHQIQAYADAKVAVLACMRALARELDPARVTVNTVDPGGAQSGFGASAGGILGRFQVISNLLTPSAERAGRTTVWVATDPGLTGVTGRCFQSCRPRTPSRLARDDAFGAEVLARVRDYRALRSANTVTATTQPKKAPSGT